MNPLTRLGAAFIKDHPEAAAGVLEDFPPENVARQQLERARRESLLDTVPSDLADTLRRLLPYPDGTAGAFMEAALASVPEGLTVRHAVKRIKRLRRGMKFYVYATNPQGQLTGVLTLHELINAPAASSVAQVMGGPVIRLSPMEPLASAVNSPYWQEFHALPVTDADDVLLGVIRQKTLRRFQEQSVQHGVVSDGLGALLAVSELFCLTAGQLVSTLIATGTRPHERRGRD
jgi:Mg/Co/Ni transporter MgtE